MVFCMTRHCNSTLRVSGTAAGGEGGGGDIFHAVVLSFGFGECCNLFIGTPVLCDCTIVGQINSALRSHLAKRRMPSSKLFSSSHW